MVHLTSRLLAGLPRSLQLVARHVVLVTSRKRSPQPAALPVVPVTSRKKNRQLAEVHAEQVTNKNKGGYSLYLVWPNNDSPVINGRGIVFEDYQLKAVQYKKYRSDGS